MPSRRSFCITQTCIYLRLSRDMRPFSRMRLAAEEAVDATGIHIFASYNALESESAKEVWESDELHATEDSPASTRVLTENTVRLCGWKAIQAVVEYTSDSRSPLRKDEVIVALDHSPNEASRESVGRVYVLRLRSTSDRFENDGKWFEEVG
jgi:hypothetical protein